MTIPKLYYIWYYKDEFARDATMGYEWFREHVAELDRNDLSKTHVELCHTVAESMNGVYAHMQGEVWSPNGEARDLIRSKGLSYTSMSMGDIIVGPDSIPMMVDRFGSTEVKNI